MFLTNVVPRIILAINEKNNYINKLIKETGGSVSYVSKIIKYLIEVEIIEHYKIKHNKRIKRLKLTEKGIELKNNLLIIKEVDDNTK